MVTLTMMNILREELIQINQTSYVFRYTCPGQQVQVGTLEETYTFCTYSTINRDWKPIYRFFDSVNNCADYKQIHRNKMHLDQLPWFATFELHRFFPFRARGHGQDPSHCRYIRLLAFNQDALSDIFKWSMYMTDTRSAVIL